MSFLFSYLVQIDCCPFSFSFSVYVHLKPDSKLFSFLLLLSSSSLIKSLACLGFCACNKSCTFKRASNWLVVDVCTFIVPKVAIANRTLNFCGAETCYWLFSSSRFTTNAWTNGIFLADFMWFFSGNAAGVSLTRSRSLL